MIETLIISLSIIFTGAYIGHVIENVFTGEDGQMPDNQEVPDQDEEEAILSDEVPYGSDALHEKNEAFNERIEALKKDLEQPPGVIYPEDHSIVDKQYIQVPPEEYAK